MDDIALLCHFWNIVHLLKFQGTSESKSRFQRVNGGKKVKDWKYIYTSLKMQKYLQLENLTKKQAIVVFKFRSRMAPFGENFRSGKLSTICPLCSAHVDSQENSLDCPTLRREVRIKGSYSDIFSENIPEDLTKTIFDIYNYRKEFQEWTARTHYS